MTGNELRQKYLDFFVSKGHKVIPAAPLIPENDPTTLFTSSGMQPLVPYLLGEKHPEGVRLVDSQPSFRAQDIEEVGDNRHTTFFEMLGNWSLGDYFKKEQLPWIWEFLTEELGLDKNRLYVTVFEGDPSSGVPKDQESIDIWKSLGLTEDHIRLYGVKKNWWSRSGTPTEMPAGEPGGTTSEVFFEFTQVEHRREFGEICHPNCDCGRFIEIANSVFMEYKKQDDGSLASLPAKNVDFGGGLERMLGPVNNTPDLFTTDLFTPLIQEIESFTDKKYADHPSEFQVIADHLKAATFMIAADLEPGNKQQGYILRRLIRRSINSANSLGVDSNFTKKIPPIVQQIYSKTKYLSGDIKVIQSVLDDEETKFRQTLERGLRELQKLNNQLAKKNESKAPKIADEAKYAFDLYQSYGLPIDIYFDELKEETQRGYSLEVRQEILEEFNMLLSRHQETSRTAAKGMFKGGLADHSDTVVKYHTATHLLHSALRKILGDHVQQTGSNITGDRLRFDFQNPQALTDEEMQKVEDLVNQKIEEGIAVEKSESTYDQATSEGALGFFGQKYPEKVTVYTIGNFSKELCGGPHVNNTAEIGKIKLTRQESVGSGRRRLYAQLQKK